jgi:RNA polymerase sigma-70 factor (ECF subfamily)
MARPSTEPLRQAVDTIYRSESHRGLATLIRLLGDLDRAQETLHDACAVAVEKIRAVVDLPVSQTIRW